MWSGHNIKMKIQTNIIRSCQDITMKKTKIMRSCQDIKVKNK